MRVGEEVRGSGSSDSPLRAPGCDRAELILLSRLANRPIGIRQRIEQTTFRNQGEARSLGETCELEPTGESVKLTIIHEMQKPESRFIETVSKGWPLILASLKSLLETGESLVETRTWPKEM